MSIKRKILKWTPSGFLDIQRPMPAHSTTNTVDVKFGFEHQCSRTPGLRMHMSGDVILASQQYTTFLHLKQRMLLWQSGHNTPPQVSFDSRPPLQAPACQCQVGCWFLSVMRVKEANHDQSFWPVSALAGKDMAHQDDNAGNHSSRSSLTLSFTSSTAKCANGLTLQPASSQLCPSFHQHKLTCSVLRKNCTPGSFRCLHATNIPRATQSLYLQSKPQTP